MFSSQSNSQSFKRHTAIIDDGILDIFVGWIFFFAGLMLFTGKVWLSGLFIAIFIPALWSARHHLPRPRLSKHDISLTVRRHFQPLSQKGLNSKTAGILSLILAGVLTALGAMFTISRMPASSTRTLIQMLAIGFIGALLFAGFSAAARNYSARRWYGYIFLLAVCSLPVIVLNISLHWLLMAIGGLISLAGTIYLAKFLLNHSFQPLVERTTAG